MKFSNELLLSGILYFYYSNLNPMVLIAYQVLWQVTKGYPLESIPVTVDTCVILPPFSYATKSPGLKL